MGSNLKSVWVDSRKRVAIVIGRPKKLRSLSPTCFNSPFFPVIINRPGPSQGLLYKHRRHSLIKRLIHIFPPLALQQCHAQMVRDSSSSYKTSRLVSSGTSYRRHTIVVCMSIQLFECLVNSLVLYSAYSLSITLKSATVLLQFV